MIVFHRRVLPKYHCCVLNQLGLFLWITNLENNRLQRLQAFRGVHCVLVDCPANTVMPTIIKKSWEKIVIFVISLPKCLLNCFALLLYSGVHAFMNTQLSCGDAMNVGPMVCVFRLSHSSETPV